MIRKGTKVVLINDVVKHTFKVESKDNDGGVIIVNILSNQRKFTSINNIQRLDEYNKLNNINKNSNKIMSENIQTKENGKFRLVVTRSKFDCNNIKSLNLNFKIYDSNNYLIRHFNYLFNGIYAISAYNTVKNDFVISDGILEDIKNNKINISNCQILECHSFQGSSEDLKKLTYFGSIFKKHISPTADCQTSSIHNISSILASKVNFGSDLEKCKKFDIIISEHILFNLLMVQRKNQFLFSYRNDDGRNYLETIKTIFGKDSIVFKQDYVSTRSTNMSCVLVRTANLRNKYIAYINNNGNGQNLITEVHT